LASFWRAGFLCLNRQEDMESKLATTLGRRPLSLAMVSTGGREPPPYAVVHKWQIYRAICEASGLGVTDRARRPQRVADVSPGNRKTVPRRPAGVEAAENAPGLLCFPQITSWHMHTAWRQQHCGGTWRC
jgi:hypothetical protein